MRIDAIKELVNEIKLLFESHEISWNNNFLRWEIPDNIEADLSINILSISHKSKKTIENIFLTFSEKIKKTEYKLFLTKPGYINILFSINQYKKILFNKKHSFKKENLEEKKKK